MPRLRDPKRNKDGTFGFKNTAALDNAGGPGRPPRGKDVRWHLCRLLESDRDELLEVTFSDGELLARQAIEAAKQAPIERKVREVKDIVETAYGAKAVTTNTNHDFSTLEVIKVGK